MTDEITTPQEQTTELAKPASQSIQTGGPVAALMPRNIEETFRLADGLVKGGGAPRGMNPMEAFTVIAKGLELGFAPLQALSTIANINGRLSIYGDGLTAIARRGGNQVSERIDGNGDARTATCTVTRKDTGEEITRTFSVSDARTARLWGKAGPWSQYPDRMLAARARGFAIRDGLSDQLFGLHVAEESEDIPERKPVNEPTATQSRLQARLGTAETPQETVDAEPETAETAIHPDDWLEFITDQEDPALIVSAWITLQSDPLFTELPDAKQKALSAATNARVTEVEQEIAA